MSRGRRRLDRLAALFRPPRGVPAGRALTLLSGGERFCEARALVAAFYAVLFFLATGSLFSWEGYLAVTELDPRWPVFWLRWVEPRAGIAAVLALYLVGGLVAVTLTRYRLARIVVFVTLLQFLAFRFSFGSINNGSHLGLLLAFVLIFLPAGWHARPVPGRATRAATLLVFSGCQAMLMLTYSMSGFWKALAVVRQTFAGEVHYLYPRGLAQQVAAKLIAADEVSLLGPWLIEQAWVGWPLAVAAIYLELFALWAVFRPSLHQAWGLGLILLHLGTHLTMGIGFPENALWLVIFFLLSPFRPRVPGLRRAVAELPVVGRWLARAEPRTR